MEFWIFLTFVLRVRTLLDDSKDKTSILTSVHVEYLSILLDTGAQLLIGELR